MNKKEEFIAYIDEVVPEMPENVAEFWTAFKGNKSLGGMTENGQSILKYMQENFESVDNQFKAKDIGEGLFMSSRSVSGAMRKLVTDGYAQKTPGNPVIYSISDQGKAYTF